jgi:hypothetical protein
MLASVVILPLSMPDYYDAETWRYMPKIATVLPIFLPLSLPIFGPTARGEFRAIQKQPGE